MNEDCGKDPAHMQAKTWKEIVTAETTPTEKNAAKRTEETETGTAQRSTAVKTHRRTHMEKKTIFNILTFDQFDRIRVDKEANRR